MRDCPMRLICDFFLKYLFLCCDIKLVLSLVTSMESCEAWSKLSSGGRSEETRAFLFCRLLSTTPRTHTTMEADDQDAAVALQLAIQEDIAPRASFSTLPRELKARIIKMCVAADQAYRARIKHARGVQGNAAVSLPFNSPVGRSLYMLAAVDKEFNKVTAPWLFSVRQQGQYSLNAELMCLIVCRISKQAKPRPPHSATASFPYVATRSSTSTST